MILLDQPEYGFLKTDPHLGKNIIFLTCGGSYSYGTNVEGFDIDIRGYTLNSKADLLDMGNFEQMIDDHADTTWKSGWTMLSKTLSETPDLARIEAFQAEVNERVSAE